MAIDIFSILLSWPAVLIYGCILGGVVVVIIYMYILKPRKDTEIFEFESFEDTCFHDLQKTFNIEGIKSRGKLLHGFKNPLGSVEKWLHYKGKWVVLEYDEKMGKYKAKQSIVKIEKKDRNGKIIKDGKGKIQYDKKTVDEKVPYDLWLFRVKGEGIFDAKNYIIVDNKFLDYDAQGNRYVIDPNVRLVSFAKAWITSESGEIYLSEVSFRKSLENNMTFVQNYARKVIFLETSHAKDMEKLLGKGKAKALGYQTFATNALIRDSTSIEEEDET